jgi:type II restriction/modification system DNA methylase subunit YeeA
MNLKTFAQESRTVMMEGVAKKLLYWGFNGLGEVVEEPQKISGGYLMRGEPFDDPNVPKLWAALKSVIATKGIEVVVEEAAYTWFNRMMAMKILAQNGYDEAQLDYVEGMQHTPMLLQRARQGNYSFLEAKEQERLKKIISDYNKDQEALALLLTGYCHSHNTLNRVFGKLDDYTELLLPDNMLQDGGFLHLLNTTDAISQDDYQTVELIGWLYQFYISEKKDEVFASFKKNKKAEAKDIPAATQIFTPNWIVKYMVENTAGKIWLDKNPNSPLRDKMKYLVESNGESVIANHEERSGKQSLINNVEDLTLIDPACGSGHILVEGFDLLYQMYMEEYYTPEEAVEAILQKNLFGLDIDVRAAQLSNFAILLKAAKVYNDVWTKDWMPQVYAMPEAQNFDQQELKDFLGTEGADYLEELDNAMRLMKQAKNLGSVMKLRLSADAQAYIAQRFEELKTASYRDFNVEAVYQSIQYYIPVLLLLTKKYTSVVANPPYMGQKNMNARLKNYVYKHYPLSKIDLYSIFMESTLALTQRTGLMGMINQHSWMFLSSYESFRNWVLENHGFVSMLHLGTRTFEELGGEIVQSVAFVVGKKNRPQYGKFFRLVDFGHVQLKESAFLNDEVEPYTIEQSSFDHLPNKTFAYWLPERIVKCFNHQKISDYAISKAGIVSGSDAKFIRYWPELSKKRISLNETQFSSNNGVVWVPVNKGGSLTKYYGNNEYVINLKDLWTEGKTSNSVRRGDPEYYFKEAITWSYISGTKFGFRIANNSVFATASPSLFFTSHFNLLFALGFLNSKISSVILPAINPTVSLPTGSVECLPILLEERDKVIAIVEFQVYHSTKEWNMYETSWDFEQSPLLGIRDEGFGINLESAYSLWEERVAKDFFQLHANEEELNRIFIDIYGLQDELTPEVALKDITILQEEIDRKELERIEPVFRAQGQEAIALPIDRSEVISQFISYAIGLFMGRYRLDKPDLNIAHPNPSTEELASYTYNGGQVTIDEDAILPLMGSRCKFPDDALHQIHGLLDTIWGHDTRTENINFIQECLDKDLENFLTVNNAKGFYKYHCSMYKKKPIYWLFSSKKGAFQVLVYMHRMNAFTAEKIRANYLLEHIKHLESEKNMLAANESNLSTQEARKLEQIRKDITECEEYDMELKNVADQQIQFDLDDGVTVNYKLFERVVARIK